MAKRELKWIEVRSEGPDGRLLGHYAIDGEMIVVQNQKGQQKSTGQSADNARLARVMLREM